MPSTGLEPHTKKARQRDWQDVWGGGGGGGGGWGAAARAGHSWRAGRGAAAAVVRFGACTGYMQAAASEAGS